MEEVTPRLGCGRVRDAKGGWRFVSRENGKSRSRAWAVTVVDRITPDMLGGPLRGQAVLGCVDYTSRTIYLKRAQSDRELLRTILHELRHVQEPGADHRMIEREAVEAAELILACGFSTRCPECGG